VWRDQRERTRTDKLLVFMGRIYWTDNVDCVDIEKV